MTEITPSRPSALWKRMNGVQRHQAADAFWREEASSPSPERAEAVSVLAERLRFRPKSVLAMPLERRIRALASTHTVSEPLASRLVVGYHLAVQRPMMSAFLDALGISHEDGLIDEEASPEVDEARLEAAVAALRARFPAEDVSLYFATLLMQDPETWGALARVELRGDEAETT